MTMKICLASSSPRRSQLLTEAGYDVVILPPHIDDGRLVRAGGTPRQWVMSLAYLKARAVAEHLTPEQVRAIDVVLGADTVCVVDGEIHGQPVDADDARRMIRAMAGRSHQTITGVCLLDVADDRRMLASDAAMVEVGEIAAEQIESYVDSGEWRGKAGAYNLAERIEAGWPIVCHGDPATVMGLPMAKLPDWLRAFTGTASVSTQEA